MPTVDFTWLFIKMMGVLIVICVAAFIVLKYVAPRIGILQRMAKGQHIHIVSRAVLGARTHLWIVRIGTRHFLLGSGERGVTALSELSAKDVEVSDET